MKKQFCSLFACTALLLSIVCSAHTAWAASSSDDGGAYTDPDTGVCFIVPDGWEVDTFNLEEAASYFQIKYISRKDPGSSFLYGSDDLWSTMSESRRSGHTRSEIDSAYIYEEWSSIESLINLAPEMGITIDPADVHLITYGKNEFIETPEIQEMAGIRIESSLFWYVENGYVYTFTFLGTGDQAVKDFHSVLSSFQVPAAGTSGSGGRGSGQAGETVELYKRIFTNFFLFLLELGITFLIYALPFVIYRHAIRKRPVGKKVLLIIIIVLYEFVVWVLLNIAMSLFLRSYANIFIPFIWGWFSYRKMVRGKDSDDLPEDAGGSAAPQQPVRTAPPSAPAAYIPAAPAPQTPQASPHLPAAPATQNSGSAARQMHKKTKQCKACGADIDPHTRKCTACGKPAARVQSAALALAAVSVLLVCSLVVNLVQYGSSAKVQQELEQQLESSNAALTAQESDLLQLENQLRITEASRERLKALYQQTKTDLEEAQKDAYYFDLIHRFLTGSNAGYASAQFYASKSVLILSLTDEAQSFSLITGFSGYVEYSFRTSSNSASVSYTENSWHDSTTIRVAPRSTGATFITFSNNLNSQTFRVLVIVTD